MTQGYRGGSTNWLEFAQILRILQARRENDGVLKRQMVSVRDAYNGDYVIPLPDVQGSPTLRALAPSLVSDAIDARAQAAASRLPSVFCPAGKPGQVSSTKKAMVRQRATDAWAAESKMGLLLRRYYRHLGGYAQGAMLVVPDYKLKIPRIYLRDPLTAYPEPRSPEDVCPPLDCAFVYEKGAGECARMWPADAEGNSLASYWDDLKKTGKKVELVEWIDPEQITIGVIGSVDLGASYYNTAPQGMCLSSVPNRMGVAPIAVGQAVTLDRVQAHMVKLLPQVEWLDKILGLETIAAEKSVFPDLYAIGKDGQMPQINGDWQDGRTGIVNTLGNTSQVGQLVSPIGPGAGQMAATIERNVRVSSGNTGVYGGEMNGSVRSGQTITQLQGISSDPRVAEMHEIAENQLEQIYRHCVNMAKKQFGSTTISLYSGQQGDYDTVTYTPSEDFDTDAVKVEYPFPGSDINQITVAVGQMKGAGIMSARQAMTVHPLVPNPEAEIRQMTLETIQAAVQAGFAQQIAAGSVPLPDAASVLDKVRKGMELADAINAVHEEAQKRQAAQAPQPDPGMATDPSQQPGLAMPGQGVESQPAPSVGPPPQGSQNFSQMLQAMRAPASAVA